jgi:single-stranded-DNA-specific exonuclease
LTCDTGIAAFEAAAYTQQRGVDFIISDHHDLPVTQESGSQRDLPDAHAIINPKLLPENHPLATLPGVGVAYKLIEALYRRMDRPDECEAFLDLVALGIVADIALLYGDARYLLQLGLAALRRANRPGLQAIMELAELDPKNLNEEHIGFVIGPRLNALGRLADANPIVELLTTQDMGRARTLAIELETLNVRRKLLTDQVFQAAQAQLEADPQLMDHAALVLAHPQWPAGVIGIVASRLVERYHKPTVLLAAPENELGRGSARSIPGVNISAAIASQADLLEGYGGHPMAAGLAIPPENISAFRKGLSAAVEAQVGATPLRPPLQIDAYLPLNEMDLDLVADLERLAPFGAGNPNLVLASRDMRLSSVRAVGRGEEHLILNVEDADGNTARLIWWQGAGWPLPQGVFDLAYNPRSSSYRGQPDLQLEWIDFHSVVSQPIKLGEAAPEIEVIDHRDATNPLRILQRLEAEHELQVWAEPDSPEEVQSATRIQLKPCVTLAIWTTPPSRSVFTDVLERAAPQQIHLFCADSGSAGLQEFLKRLAGLVKYTLRARQGKTYLTALAAAAAQDEDTVRLGLDWLEALGHIQVVYGVDGELEVTDRASTGGEDPGPAQAKLVAALAETAAYRDFFKRADANFLIRY